jgi:flagellar biosynthesis component FlhA
MNYTTGLKILAIALLAAVLVFPPAAIPIPFGTRFILLGALAIGGVIWLTSEDQQAEEERERQANEERWRRQQEQAEQEAREKKDDER